MTAPEAEPGDTELTPDGPAVIDCPPSGRRVRVRESAADTDYPESRTPE